MENDIKSIINIRKTYKKRINLLTKILKEYNLKPAVKPGAGFFTLWLAPKEAFGESIKNAKHFNSLMIEHTGVVGVPFGNYIRYAVTSPIEQPDWQEAIIKGFSQAKIK